MTSKGITISNTTPFFVIFMQMSVQNILPFLDSFFLLYFQRSNALTLHETLIEKIYSGKKRYHSNLYDQCLPNYHILKIQYFFREKRKKK